MKWASDYACLQLIARPSFLISYQHWGATVFDIDLAVFRRVMCVRMRCVKWKSYRRQLHSGHGSPSLSWCTVCACASIDWGAHNQRWLRINFLCCIGQRWKLITTLLHIINTNLLSPIYRIYIKEKCHADERTLAEHKEHKVVALHALLGRSIVYAKICDCEWQKRLHLLSFGKHKSHRWLPLNIWI